MLCVDLSETLDARDHQRHQQEDVHFLSRLARKQTPTREQQPAEFLLSMARLRMCLDTAARILPRAISHKSGEAEKFFRNVCSILHRARLLNIDVIMFGSMYCTVCIVSQMRKYATEYVSLWYYKYFIFLFLHLGRFDIMNWFSITV